MTSRSSTRNTANLLTVARKMVAGAGPPWYTSGVHRWKGTMDSLKPRPTTISTAPARVQASGVAASPAARPARSIRPVRA